MMLKVQIAMFILGAFLAYEGLFLTPALIMSLSLATLVDRF